MKKMKRRNHCHVAGFCRQHDRKENRKRSGAITVYLTLTVPILLSLFFGAVEAAKSGAYRVMADCAFRSAIVSAFGEYHRELLKQYDLFFIDLSYLSDTASYAKLAERVRKRMEENINPTEERVLSARDFFGKASVDFEINSAYRATDRFGEVMERQAVYYMKDLVSADFISDMKSLIRITEQYHLTNEEFQRANEELKQRQQALAGAKNKNLLTDEQERNFTASSSTDVRLNLLTPMDYLIMKEDAKGVSRKTINPLDTPSHRKEIFASGDGAETDAPKDPSAGIFFNEYIMQKCGNYVHPKEGSCLKYEAEYVYAGTSADSMNLSLTIATILGIRTMANAVSLYKDDQKMEEIRSVATVLAAITRLPDQIYEYIILMIWAAMESTYDVEELLNGEKVELIKDAGDFHLSLTGGVKGLTDGGADYSDLLEDKERGGKLPSTDIGNQKSGVDSLGAMVKLSYEDYLRLLLMASPNQTKKIRMLDIMELDIRETEDNETFRMDQCVDRAGFTAHISAEDVGEYVISKEYGY